MADILFTTCQEWPNPSPSDAILAEALRKFGHSVRHVCWDDPSLEQFQNADLVVLRANWDYHKQVAKFRQWLDCVAGSTCLLNPAALVHWNLHKAYMLELQSRGLRVPHSILFEANMQAQDICDYYGWSQAVVKPVYGASGTSVELKARTELSAWMKTIRLGSLTDSWLIQEFIPEVQTEGELSIVFLNGMFSHAICKTPQAGEFRTNSKYKPVITRIDSLEQHVINQAEEFLRPLCEKPLYARVDGVLTPSGFQLLELELNEPALYFHLAPEKAEDFARAIHTKVIDAG